MNAISAALCVLLAADAPRPDQNPSPMVERTRAHLRLERSEPAGARLPLRMGTLFIPDDLPDGAPLVLHFHGATWIPELAASKQKVAVISLQLGSGSSAYAKPFADPTVFSALLREVEEKARRTFDTVGLTAWSAGYGAVREVLESPAGYERVSFVLLLDGLHAGYVSGKPGPLESEIVAEDLAVFVKLAKDAAGGRKRFLVAHTAIFPGTFASTTETADYLLDTLDLERTPVLRWGPMGTQILGEARRGEFRVLTFAGNSAPDHVDLLHSLPDLLGEVLPRTLVAP